MYYTALEYQNYMSSKIEFQVLMQFDGLYAILYDWYITPQFDYIQVAALAQSQRGVQLWLGSVQCRVKRDNIDMRNIS